MSIPLLLYIADPSDLDFSGHQLQIIGSNETPFAVSACIAAIWKVRLIVDYFMHTQVKGAGHAANPSFSSTTGVQIAMYRFSEVSICCSIEHWPV